jgi:hypothetical protein
LVRPFELTETLLTAPFFVFTVTSTSLLISSPDADASVPSPVFQVSIESSLPSRAVSKSEIDFSRTSSFPSISVLV